MPLAGGLVGFTAYDVVRFFERLPMRHVRRPDAPILHYVAPRSLLVFDHLTRGIALLHAGSEAERQALRREVIAALRGGLRNHSAPRQLRRAGGFAGTRGLHGRRAPRAGVHRGGRRLPARAVLAIQGRHSLDPFQVYRALRLINPVAVHVSTAGSAASRWSARRPRRW